MNLLKKDWDYTYKMAAYQMTFILVCFIVLAFFLGINEEFDSNMYSIYQALYNGAMIYLGVFPISIFKLICPKQGAIFKAPNITAMLPISKKNLLLNQLKPWFVFIVIYWIIATVLYFYYLSFNPWSTNNMFVLMLGCLGGSSLLGLQMTIIFINKLSRPDCWVKKLIKHVIKQSMLLLPVFILSIFVPFVLQYLLVICYVLCLGYSVLEFMKVLPLLEEIYQ